MDGRFERVECPVFGIRPDDLIEFLREHFEEFSDDFCFEDAYGDFPVRMYFGEDFTDEFDLEMLEDLEVLSEESEPVLGACLRSLVDKGVLESGLYIVDRCW
jgi:hypothetical protein